MKDQRPVQKKNSRVLSILIIIVLILIALGIYSHYKHKNVQPDVNTPPAQNVNNPDQNQPNPNNSTQNSNKTMLPSPKTIAPFTLTDDSGKTITNENLKGKWTLMFFGFTRCADVCPTTLTELNKMYSQLQQANVANLPQVIFVSVDPERDNINALHNYIKNFNPNFIAATGSADNLNVFVKDLGVYYTKVDKDNNDYGMNHSSQIYLINPEGNWAGIFTYPQPAQQLADNYKDLLNPQQST